MKKAQTIYNWKKRGLICKEGETYDDIYNHVMSVNNCELCNIEFTDDISRCMDHSHDTGYFRKVLCNKCNLYYNRKPNKNNKLGHKWISFHIEKNKYGKYGTFLYKRQGFKSKKSISLTLLICLSFINIMKKPI